MWDLNESFGNCNDSLRMKGGVKLVMLLTRRATAGPAWMNIQGLEGFV